MIIVREEKIVQGVTPISSLPDFFARHDEIRSRLRELFPERSSWRWVDFAILLIRLEFYYGECRPSARFVMQNNTVVGQSADPQIFWRFVKKLENLGLLQRFRRLRPNGSWTSNSYNVRPLIHLLSYLVTNPSTKVEITDDEIRLKIGGFWRAFDPRESKLT